MTQGHIKVQPGCSTGLPVRAENPPSLVRTVWQRLCVRVVLMGMCTTKIYTSASPRVPREATAKT